MNRTILIDCLNAINTGFTSDLARKDFLKFATNQMQLVVNLSKAISKIDIYNHSVLNDELLGKFFDRSTYIIDEVATRCRVNRKFGNSEELSKFNNMIVEASSAILVTLCSRGNLNEREASIIKLLNLIDLKKPVPSDLVSVLAGIHRSGLYKNSEVRSFTENAIKYLINRLSSVNNRIGHEVAILLWHRAALLFMHNDLISPNHFSQLKMMLHKSFRTVVELAKSSHDDAPFRELFDTPISASRPDKQANSWEIGIPSDPATQKIRKTLLYIVQSLHIIYQHEPRIFDFLKIELLKKLVKQIRLYQMLRESTYTSRSSDTHSKISLIFADVLGNNYEYQHEVVVGCTNYTIDTVITIR